jgi:hypothetical protein
MFIPAIANNWLPFEVGDTRSDAQPASAGAPAVFARPWLQSSKYQPETNRIPK